MPQATPAKDNDSAALFSFPAVARKKVTAAFDGGLLRTMIDIYCASWTPPETGVISGFAIHFPH